MRAFVIILGFSIVVPAVVSADPRTVVTGVVTLSSGGGPPVGTKVTAEWTVTPTFGQNCQIRTIAPGGAPTVTFIGTTTGGTDVGTPSVDLACQLTTQCTCPNGLCFGPACVANATRPTIEVNFSDENTTSNCGNTPPKTFCYDLDGNPGGPNAVTKLTSLEGEG